MIALEETAMMKSTKFLTLIVVLVLASIFTVTAACSKKPAAEQDHLSTSGMNGKEEGSGDLGTSSDVDGDVPTDLVPLTSDAEILSEEKKKGSYSVSFQSRQDFYEIANFYKEKLVASEWDFLTFTSEGSFVVEARKGNYHILVDGHNSSIGDPGEDYVTDIIISIEHEILDY